MLKNTNKIFPKVYSGVGPVVNDQPYQIPRVYPQLITRKIHPIMNPLAIDFLIPKILAFSSLLSYRLNSFGAPLNANTVRIEVSTSSAIAPI